MTKPTKQGQPALWQGWPLLALALAALLLLWPVLVGGQVLLPGSFLTHFEPWRSELGEQPARWNSLLWDAMAQYYPWRTFAARTLHAGYLPLWNPHQACGLPFLANAQSALLYPPHLLFVLLPVASAFGWLAWLHLLAAGGGTFLFLRALGRSREAALLGGLAFMLCGFFATWLEMTTLLASGAWLPLALWCAERYFQAPGGRWVVGLGAALGLAVLAGHPQMACYVLLGAGAYFLYRGIWSVRETGWQRAAGISAAGGLGALALAGLLSAGQLLPMAEYVAHSHRTPGGYQAYVRYALPWQQALAALLPDFFGRPSLGSYWGRGNYAEYVSYVGIVPLLLAAAGAWWGRGRHFWFFALLAAAAMLVALGTPLNAPLYYLVPGLKSSGGPARMLFLWAAALAVLAAGGADALRSRLEQGKLTWQPWLLAGGLAALAGLGGLLVWAFTPQLTPLGLLAAWSDAWGNWLVLLVMGTGCALAAALSRRRPGWLVPGLALLLVADLLAFAAGYNPTAPARDIYPATPTLRRLAAGPGRTLGLWRRWPLASFPVAALPPNWAMVYGAEDVLGYDSIYPARYKALLTAAQGSDPSPPANGNMLLARRFSPQLAARLDVRWIMGLQPGPAAPPGCRLVEQLGHSRLWWTPRPALVPGPSQAVAALQQAPQVPVLEGGSARPGLPALPLAGRWWRQGPNRLHLDFVAPGPGWVVISEQHFPGWQAWRNGRRAALRPADLALRALPVGGGRSVVHMEYRPQSFRLGLFGTLVGLALCLGGGAWLAAGRWRHVQAP